MKKLSREEEIMNQFWATHSSHALHIAESGGEWTLEKSVNNLLPEMLKESYKAGLKDGKENFKEELRAKLGTGDKDGMTHIDAIYDLI